MVAADAMTMQAKIERIYDKLMQLIFEENRKGNFDQIYFPSYIKHRFVTLDQDGKVMLSLFKAKEDM